jgi:hypothetical protein
MLDCVCLQETVMISMFHSADTRSFATELGQQEDKLTYVVE